MFLICFFVITVLVFFKWHNSWPFQLVIENKNETKWLYYLLLIWTFFLLISPSDIVSINELTWILKIICQYNVNHVVTLPIKTITAAVFWWGPRVAQPFRFLFCPIMCLYVLSSVLWCPLRFPHKNDVRFVFISSCHVLFTLFVFVCIKWFSTQWHIVLYFLFCFTSSCVPYHMLPVSLDCLFLISPWVFSSVYWMGLTYIITSITASFDLQNCSYSVYIR